MERLLSISFQVSHIFLSETGSYVFNDNVVIFCSVCTMMYLFIRTLRKLFKVDAADYMLSLCGNEALLELSSPGKSGSFFYLTNDDRYMIKTMKKSEVTVSYLFLILSIYP